MKKLAPIALGLALSQAAGAQTTIAKLTLGGEAQNVQIQYARWAMKYPVAKKQVPCSPADEEGSFTAPCYATAQTAPRLVVTVRYSERPSDEETTYKDIVINPKDLSPSNDRLEKLFKVDVRKVSAVVPVERLVCLGEGTDSSCEKETHMAKVTRTLVDVIRR